MRKRDLHPFTAQDLNKETAADTPAKLELENGSFKQGRKYPNILITGTPGCGKSTLCQQLTSRLPAFKHIDVSKEIKQNKWYSSFDEEMDSYIFSASKVRKGLARLCCDGGFLIDFHSIRNAVSPSLVDLAVVLTTNNTILYDRLVERLLLVLNLRGYSTNKIQENVECEIMQILVEETREVFEGHADTKIMVLKSDSTEDLEANCGEICKYLQTEMSGHN